METATVEPSQSATTSLRLTDSHINLVSFFYDSTRFRKPNFVQLRTNRESQKEGFSPAPYSAISPDLLFLSLSSCAFRYM